MPFQEPTITCIPGHDMQFDNGQKTNKPMVFTALQM